MYTSLQLSINYQVTEGSHGLGWGRERLVLGRWGEPHQAWLPETRYGALTALRGARRELEGLGSGDQEVTPTGLPLPSLAGGPLQDWHTNNPPPFAALCPGAQRTRSQGEGRRGSPAVPLPPATSPFGAKGETRGRSRGAQVPPLGSPMHDALSLPPLARNLCFSSANLL